MEKFAQLTGKTCPLLLPNVNTDQIVPARYLKLPRAAGLGPVLFHDLRRDPDGNEKADFPLNQPVWRDAAILIAGRNFGGGSSREAAAFAFDAYGIRCVIAVSFGDIFYNNCPKNGILAIRLPEQIAELLRKQLHAHPGAKLTVDLPAQNVTDVDGGTHAFDIDPFRKHCLVEGLSQIKLTLRHSDEIDAFERRYRETVTWI